MRRVLLGDLIAASCCLAAQAPPARPPLARRMIAEADAAHRYMKRFGRPHPEWGIGTLEVRANALKSGPNIGFDLNDARILAAMALLARTLQNRAQSLALPPKPPMC